MADEREQCDDELVVMEDVEQWRGERLRGLSATARARSLPESVSNNDAASAETLLVGGVYYLTCTEYKADGRLHWEVANRPPAPEAELYGTGEGTRAFCHSHGLVRVVALRDGQAFIEPVPKGWSLEMNELVRGDVRLWETGRAQSVREGWQEMYGVDMEAFLADHEARSKTWEYHDGTKRKDYGNGQGLSAVAMAGWGESFSYIDVERDGNRLILVDTCERRVLLESKDVRLIFEQETSAKTLALWREAAKRSSDVPPASVVTMLLNELERMSILMVFMDNGVDCGKFL